MTLVLVCTLLASILIYCLTLIYMKEYINVSSINLEFASKVFLIVAGSWGILFVLRVLQHCVSPSYTETVLRNAQPFDTSKFERSPDKRDQAELKAFGFETENDDDEDFEDYNDNLNERETDKKPLL